MVMIKMLTDFMEQWSTTREFMFLSYTITNQGNSNEAITLSRDTVL